MAAQTANTPGGFSLLFNFIAYNFKFESNIEPRTSD